MVLARLQVIFENKTELLCFNWNHAVIYFAPMTAIAQRFLNIFFKAVSILLCIAVPSAVFAADGFKVTYDGGSIPEAKTGSELRLFIEQDRIRFLAKNAELITIPASAVTEISGRMCIGG